MTSPRRRRPTAITPALGSVRRGQLITTYGVGAMIALGDASYIVTGLDTWKTDSNSVVHEPRLEMALGITELRLPPAQDWRHGATLRRFPAWYSCTDCRLLQTYRKFTARGSKCSCGGRLIPSRFVLACDSGHIDDFPYWQWVHRGSPTTGTCTELRLEAGSQTASLRSIEITCGCGKTASMEGAFRRTELIKLGIRCPGGSPWLGPSDRTPDCTAEPRTLQRGSSATWFGIVRSSLAIPPWSTRLQKLIDRHYSIWKNDDDATIVKQAANAGLLSDTIKGPHIVAAVRQRTRLLDGTSQDADNPADLRAEEYEQLCTPTDPNEDSADDFETVAADRTPHPLIDRVMLVNRLREVRALESFTRIEPYSPADPADRRAAVAAVKPNWLPAVEIIGEGVFLRLDNTALAQWESRPAVVARAEKIRQHHQRLLDHRAERAQRQAPASPATGRLIALHTLAHLLINEWSLEAGYPAASMRERLYVNSDMAGILIYTATSDSAGSLGGIVRQGEADHFTRSLQSALRRAEWCSADPLCMESDATGADNLNLAACHACTLLPETSCEFNNTFLDRGLVTGWQAQENIGLLA
jgi:hypothetical protein